MKRIMALLLIVLLVFGQAVPCFAEEGYVSATYNQGILRASGDVENGASVIVLGSGETVSVMGAPETAEQAVVLNIPSSEEAAWKWFGECLGESQMTAAYEVVLLDAQDNSVSNQGTQITIPVPLLDGHYWVYGLTTAGTSARIAVTQQPGQVSFTGDGSTYYIAVAADGTQQNPCVVDTLPATVTLLDAHDVNYAYIAREDCTLTITCPEGCEILGLPEEAVWEETTGTYYLKVSAGQLVQMRIRGENGGEYAFGDTFVAQNIQTGKKYENLTEALTEAGANQTVNLMKDCLDEGTVFIPSGVTLHLQDYGLRASSVIGLNGSYLAGTPFNDDAHGQLIVPEGNLAIMWDGSYFDGQYNVLPVYSTEAGGYVFSRFEVNTNQEKNRGLSVNPETDTLYFQFVTNMSGRVSKELLNDGAKDNNVAIMVSLSWQTSQGDARLSFEYNEEQIAKVCGGGYDFCFTMNGLSALEIEGTLVVSAYVISECGSVVYGTQWYYPEMS